MSKKINYLTLVLVFILFVIQYYTKEKINYDWWIIIFLFLIAQGVNKYE